MQLMVTFSSQLTTSSLYKLDVHRAIFCPTLHHQIRILTPFCDVTATCNHALLGTWSIQMAYKTHLYCLPVVKVADCGVMTN